MITVSLDHGLTEESYPELIAAIRKEVAATIVNDEPQTHNGFEFHVPVYRTDLITGNPISVIGFVCSNAPESGFSETLAWINGEIVGSESGEFELDEEEQPPLWEERYADTRAWYEAHGFIYPSEWMVR